jgi:flagellar basal body-associated protein FliL
LGQAFIQKYILISFIVCIVISVLVPMAYSYWLFRNRKN